MAYVINKTDGTAIVTITDGTVDNTTSLSLFGKSYSGFGEALNENLVKLLENSASTSAPTAPIAGEIWFDTNSNQLKVYDGSSFKPSGGAKSQSAEPTSASAGDLWHDSDDDQLYVYTGSAWLLVGPVYSSGQTLSGWDIETINNSSGVSKVISSMYVGNTRVAILSKEAITPQVSMSGFSTIASGLTLNSTLGASFSGTTTSASAVDVSGTTNTSSTVIAGGNFLRADAADTTTGAITIDSDDGLVVGDEGELTATVSSGNVTIAQTRQDKNLSFTINDGGSTVTPLTFTGSTGAIGMVGDVTITGNLNVSGEYSNTSSVVNTVKDAFIKLNTGESEVDSGLIIETSDTDDARLFYDVSENHFVAGQGASYSQIIRLADATDDGGTNHSTALKSSSSGGLTLDSLTLSAVGSISTSNTSTTTVASTGATVTLINSLQSKWGDSAKIVDTDAPDDSEGNDGDFYFQREA